MKKIKFTTGDVILMSIYGLTLTMGIINCFHSDPGELHQNINTCIWITSSIMWFFGFRMIKKVASRNDRMIEAGNKTTSEVAQKALSSAPSNLNTYEKSVYEEGFKDGVNFIKNEMNSVL
jgi:4-hydroxybenzoate polyprenyltransferase